MTEKTKTLTNEFFFKKILTTLECPICLCFKGTYVLNCSHRVCGDCVYMIYRTTQDVKKREENKKRTKTNIKCAYCNREYEWSHSSRKQERICRIDVDARNIMNVTSKYIERDDLCNEKHAYLPMNIICRTCNDKTFCALCYVEDHKSHDCVRLEDYRRNCMRDFGYLFLFKFSFHQEHIGESEDGKSTTENFDHKYSNNFDLAISSFCPTPNHNVTGKEVTKVIDMTAWPKQYGGLQKTTIKRGSTIAYISDNGLGRHFVELGMFNATNDFTFTVEEYIENFSIEIFKLKPDRIERDQDVDTSIDFFVDEKFKLIAESMKFVRIQDVLVHGLQTYFYPDFTIKFSSLSVEALKSEAIRYNKICT